MGFGHAQGRADGEPVLYKANEVRGRYRFEWTERALARGFRYTDQGEGPPGMQRPLGMQQPTGSMTTAGLAR